MAEGDGEQVEWLDAFVRSVTEWHERIIDQFGGVHGVHAAKLYAACARPFHTFDGVLLYSDLYLQAAALLHGIICDHAFVDGNKRTATIFASVLIPMDSPPIPLQMRLLGDVALDTAMGTLSVEQVAYWMERIFPRPASPASEAVIA